MNTPSTLLVLALCSALLTACSEEKSAVQPSAESNAASPTATTTPLPTTSPIAVSPVTPSPEAAGPLQAVAELQPTQGNNVKGTVTFTEVADGVRVNAEITGLTPGKHGFHVHEKGDCSAPDATSAGDHFNPTSKPHGAADALERHDGDMGNIEADASGEAKLNYIDHNISLVAGERSVIGRGVIVHANPDDLTSQPSGNAGARVACGVITRAGGSER